MVKYFVLGLSFMCQSLIAMEQKTQKAHYNCVPSLYCFAINAFAATHDTTWLNNEEKYKKLIENKEQLFKQNKPELGKKRIVFSLFTLKSLTYEDLVCIERFRNRQQATLTHDEYLKYYERNRRLLLSLIFVKSAPQFSTQKTPVDPYYEHMLLNDIFLHAIMHNHTELTYFIAQHRCIDLDSFNAYVKTILTTCKDHKSLQEIQDQATTIVQQVKPLKLLPQPLALQATLGANELTKKVDDLEKPIFWTKDLHIRIRTISQIVAQVKALPDCPQKTDLLLRLQGSEAQLQRKVSRHSSQEELKPKPKASPYLGKSNSFNALKSILQGKVE